MRKPYPFDLIESKWRDRWDALEAFRAWNPGETIPQDHPFARRHGSSQLPPKYYALDMFPYPSGEGLHVGHPEGYTATDIVSRFKRAQGYNVLHPIGWDAFGLPAENYAVKTGQHPRITTERNIANFKRQIKSLGFSYDWSREIDTTAPDYFKWTQWIFLRLYGSWFNPETQKAEPIQTLSIPSVIEAGSESEKRAYIDERRLAYVAEAPVNWCPELGTVLANEEVVDGKSEVGGHPVVRKPMRQWMLRITAYSDRLLQGLDDLDWPDSLKEMQRNWIGKSYGAEVDFSTVNGSRTIRVFTTRPDTLFGATYMALAPEHDWLQELTPDAWPEETPDIWKTGGFQEDPANPLEISASEALASPKKALERYQEYAARKSDRERSVLAKDKTGVFTGSYAVNPVNDKKIPIWVADYVLATYGTGAVMAVPAHDERDLDFAKAFELEIITVVEAPKGQESLGYVGSDGRSVNSDFLNGLPTPEAKKKIAEWLESNDAGKLAVQYKIRDWLFSRQRYWGEPFPIIWDTQGHAAVADGDLPVCPPEMSDFKPTGDGEPPLARAKEWVSLPNGSRRETNTMPQWAGSCWYFLRYMDPHNDQAFIAPEVEQYWLSGNPEKDKNAPYGVDLYIGGAEHAVLHLLYSRFWSQVLFDLGLVGAPEPFYKLVNQGLILGENNVKMSKSLGNVINPDVVIQQYGADAFRLYEMFMGPLEQSKPWNTQGVEGVYRFLGKLWRLCIGEGASKDWSAKLALNDTQDVSALEEIQLASTIQDVEPTADQIKAISICVKKVTDHVEGLRMNTAISEMMIFLNSAVNWDVVPVSVLKDFLKLLQPFAPHLAEELFSKLNTGQQVVAPETIAYEPWPTFDPKALVESEVEIAVQINGKLRERIMAANNTDRAELEKLVLSNSKVAEFLEGKNVVKLIVVPNKLVNIVAK